VNEAHFCIVVVVRSSGAMVVCLGDGGWYGWIWKSLFFMTLRIVFFSVLYSFSCHTTNSTVDCETSYRISPAECETESKISTAECQKESRISTAECETESRISTA